MIRLFLPLLLMASSVHAAPAAWLHTCAGDGAQAKPRQVVTGEPKLAGCTSIALPLPSPAAVETVYALGAGDTPETTILLHGNVEDGRFAVSEHDLPSSRPGPEKPSAPALRANLLAGARVRTFGVEERVTATLADGRLAIACRPGQRAAGVVITGPWYLPRADVALAARYTAAGAFDWQAADAARVERDGAIDMGALPPSAQPAAARLALPPGLDRASWRQFVVLCPATQASLRLESLALEPAGPARTAPRSTWVWRPGDWIDNGPALLDWAAAHNVGELFVTVPLKDGAAVRAPDLLADFVRAAGKRGVRVYSVDGDPHMVLAGELAAVVKRAQAYAAYNAAATPDARLAGMQFDVEPYLLPDSVLPAFERDARYLAMARALKDVAAASGSLQLEFVVPFWWAGKRELLDGLAPYADALAVMDYRTDPAQIVDFAAPFLDWAQAHGRRARIALEAGGIDAETQRRYVRAGAGEAGNLLAVDAGGRTVLLLLRQPLAVAAGANAQPYRLASTRLIDGSATTFHADKAALLRLLPQLEADFGAWNGFGGIAVHELR